MKRIFIMIACVALLAACGGNKKEVKQQDSENPKSEELVAGSIILNSADFTQKVADLSKEWKYLGDKPAVIDFYADWCGPCKAIAPHLEEIAKEYAGKLYVYKINVDNDPEIANAFNIRGIPTMLFIPVEGEPIKTIGGMEMATLVENIAKIMQ